MRKLGLAIGLALLAVAGIAAPVAAANLGDGEYVWTGGYWRDATCGTGSQTFRVDVYSSSGQGGARTRICANESDLTDVNMDDNGECNPLCPQTANDRISSVDILDLPAGCGLQFTEHNFYGGLDRVYTAEGEFGVSSSLNDKYSAVRLRCS